MLQTYSDFIVNVPRMFSDQPFVPNFKQTIYDHFLSILLH